MNVSSKAPSLSTRKKYPIHWIGEFLWGNVVPYNKKKIVCHPINSTNHAVFHCKLRQGLDTRKSKIKVQIFDASGFRILAPSKQPLYLTIKKQDLCLKGFSIMGHVDLSTINWIHLIILLDQRNRVLSLSLFRVSTRVALYAWCLNRLAGLSAPKRGWNAIRKAYLAVEGAGGVGKNPCFLATNVWISKNSAGFKESVLNEILFRVRIQRSWKRLFKRLLLTSGSVIRDDVFFLILMGGGAGNQKLRTETPPAAFPIRSLLSSGRLKSRS